VKNGAFIFIFFRIACRVFIFFNRFIVSFIIVLKLIILNSFVLTEAYYSASLNCCAKYREKLGGIIAIDLLVTSKIS
jgi:hypothetical protein